MTAAELAAALTAAAWLGGIAIGIVIGWRACVRWAAELADLDEGWAARLAEPAAGEVTGPIRPLEPHLDPVTGRAVFWAGVALIIGWPIVITDLSGSAAASLPGPMPGPGPAVDYVEDSAEFLARYRPLRESDALYAPVWDGRAARLEAIDELVEQLAARVTGLHELRGGLLTEQRENGWTPGRKTLPATRAAAVPM